MGYFRVLLQWAALSAAAAAASSLERFRYDPPVPSNYSSKGPFYLLANMYDLLAEIAKQPNVDPLAASTIFFMPPDVDDTMGNILTHYIEARLCARVASLHFVSVDRSCVALGGSGGGEGGSNPNNLYNYFEDVVFNPLAEFPASANKVETECPCTFRCHEKDMALFSKEGNGEVARNILYPAFERHSQVMNAAKKTFADMNMPHIWSAQLRHLSSSLPEIPDVAVQYRCGDNTLPGYGLLSWPAFLRHIPLNATYIYVLTENPHRRTKGTLISKCNDIIKRLADYLHFHFSDASVVVLRGGSPLDDAARLAMANVTICSASTFCLWPAIASRTASFFPRSKLVYDSREAEVHYTPEFHWLTDSDEIVISLLLAQDASTDVMIKMLKRGEIIVGDDVIAGGQKTGGGSSGGAALSPQAQHARQSSPSAAAAAATTDGPGQKQASTYEKATSSLRQPRHVWIASVLIIIAVLFVYRIKFCEVKQ